MFVMPLQLSGDYQIRAHSPFPDMQSAASYAIESFAANAPKHLHLLLKAHPLDCSFFDWAKFVRGHAERLSIEDRLHFVDGGDLDKMAREARGLVCVNSTSAGVRSGRAQFLRPFPQPITRKPAAEAAGFLFFQLP